jgi:uncharacterized glyoxalase superfamily protein PhnB
MVKLAIPLLHVSSSILAEDFYCQQLGFRKLFANRGDATDPCYMGVIRDRALLHLSSFSGDGVTGSVVNLWVDNVDEVHSELIGKGVKIDLEPTNQTWGTREMYVKDADSNCIRFHQDINSAIV